EKMEKHFEEMSSYLENEGGKGHVDAETKLPDWSTEDLDPPQGWKEFIARCSLIEWAGNSMANQPGMENCQVMEWNLSPQPVFVRQYGLLLEDLNARAEEGYTPYIFAENPRQLERL